MADTSSAPEEEKISVAAAANKCLESLQKCLSQAPSTHPREMSMIEDQMARFSIWTSGSDVFAPDQASMDHLLRHDPEMHSIAIGLLNSLNYRIGKCRLRFTYTFILCRPNTYVGSDILFDNGKSPGPYTPFLLERLRQCLSDVASEITHLNKMSNVLRRASIENHILQVEDFEIKNEYGIVVESRLLAYYKNFIRERFPRVSTTIQHRLANAMIFRQKQILYRRLCYRDELAQSPGKKPKETIALSDLQLRLGETPKAKASSQIKSATILDLYKVTMPSSPSSSSAAISIAFNSDLDFPSALGPHIKRKYEKSKTYLLEFHQAMLGKLDELLPESGERIEQERVSVKEQLRSALKLNILAIGEVACPYCLSSLPLEEVFNEQNWQ